MNDFVDPDWRAGGYFGPLFIWDSGWSAWRLWSALRRDRTLRAHDPLVGCRCLSGRRDSGCGADRSRCSSWNSAAT